MFNNSESTLKIEVTVKNFDGDFVLLQIGSYEKIVPLPRSILPEKIAIGQKFTLEIKNPPSEKVGNIIETAKNGKQKDTESMRRKLLEELIN